MGGPPLAHLAGAGPRFTAATQPPPAHPCPEGQALPQVPQFALELFVSTHARLHAVSPDWQLSEHEPTEHTWEPEQTTPQVPQLFGSALVAAQPPSQSSWLVGQVVLASAPLLPPLELLPLELLELLLVEPLLLAPELPLLEPIPLELLLAPELPSCASLSPWVASKLPSPTPPSPGVPV